MARDTTGRTVKNRLMKDEDDLWHEEGECKVRRRSEKFDADHLPSPLDPQLKLPLESRDDE
jgi:hypothetical protein